MYIDKYEVMLICLPKLAYGREHINILIYTGVIYHIDIIHIVYILRVSSLFVIDGRYGRYDLICIWCTSAFYEKASLEVIATLKQK